MHNSNLCGSWSTFLWQFSAHKYTNRIKLDMPILNPFKPPALDFGSEKKISSGLPGITSAVTTRVDSVLSSARSAVGSARDALGSAVGALDPKIGRLIGAKLPGGATPAAAGNLPKPNNNNVIFAGQADDRRVRLSLASGSSVFYHSPDPGILKPLAETGGVVFPYTPDISISYTNQYTQHPLVHTNYAQFSYEHSLVNNITVNADFSAQTQAEATYVLAVYHFFRSASKMFFGVDELAGNPPPLLFLSGYGDYALPNVPCVMQQFTHTLPRDVDYIEVGSRGQVDTRFDLADPLPEDFQVDGYQKVPTLSSVQLVLLPMYSRKKMAEFGLEDFARGKFLSGGYL
jgi:hypothetical protein